jgi:hypothetical protein
LASSFLLSLASISYYESECKYWAVCCFSPKKYCFFATQSVIALISLTLIFSDCLIASHSPLIL